MDVDDDDKYMNTAAAHAAFVMTVSAASMYWLLRHAQHARDINIHKLHPLPKKSACAALPIFCTVEHPFKRPTTEILRLWAIFAHHYLAKSDNKLTA